MAQLDSFRLSQRSNGLAFTQRDFINASVSASPRSPTILYSLPRDGTRSPRTRSSSRSPKPEEARQKPQSRRPLPFGGYVGNKSADSLEVNRPRAQPPPITESKLKANADAQRRPVRSLIPPPRAPHQQQPYEKFDPAPTNQRRHSTSSISSVKSYTSSIVRRRKYAAPPKITTVPVEILSMVFQHLDQRDLHAIMVSHPSLSATAASYIYIAPKFATTYRFAQFAHTVSHNKRYADLVRILDLSCFGSDEGPERKPEAGWREFKYRHAQMQKVSRVRRDSRITPNAAMAMSRMGAHHRSMTANMVFKPVKGPRELPIRLKLLRDRSTHPPPSPFLSSFHLTRDVPTGGVCHVLSACQNLKKVDLSFVTVAADFAINHPSYSASTWTKQLFISDKVFPGDLDDDDDFLRPVQVADIIQLLKGLPHLTHFYARRFFMKTMLIKELVTESQSLEMVDFRDAAMDKSIRWAVKADRDTVKRIIREMEINRAN